MRYKGNKIRFYKAVTLLETVIALAILAVVFTAILPLFAIIRNSWGAKQANAEMLQNGRVLIDHINRNLSKAVKITDVSSSSEIDGYIQFEDNDANEWRYEIGADNYVQFGLVGSLSDLAGPVTKLQFTCYDSNDFVNLTTDVNTIRLVKVETILTNSATLGQDKTFIASIYLRTSGNNSAQGNCWQNKDVGNVAVPGNATQMESGWTIEGSGQDIWDRYDEFHYVYQPLSGDGQIIARVVSIENTDPWAKVGVMIRETFDTSSKHANMLITTSNGVHLQYRPTTGLFTDYAYGSTASPPHWLKLTRSGNTFTGYESTDGSAWTEVAAVSISMATDVYIGLAVCSHNDPVLCTAVYDNVTFSAITYETFNEAKAGSDVTSIDINTPSTSTGDLLIAAVATDGDTSASLSPPVGQNWILINRGAYNSEVTLGAWWKKADASEPASHKFTWSGGQQAYGWMMRFTGHDSDDPIDDFSAYGESSSTPTSPAVTTTVNNCLILRLGAFDDDDITEDDPGLSGHTAITMDKTGITYMGFDEGRRTVDGMDVAVSTPAGTSEADLLVAAVVTDGDTSATISSPVDWTLINRSAYSSDVTLGVWWKLAAAGEPGTHTFTWTTVNEQAYGWIMRFTGHNPTAPINASAAQGGTFIQYPPCPSVTTTVVNTMILRIGGFDDDDINVDDPGLTSSHAAITMDKSTTGTTTCSGGAGYMQQAAIGASGTANFSLTAKEEYRTVTIAIAPVASGKVSGGTGYLRQPATGSSGTSTFSLGSLNEAQMLTIAIAPDPESGGGGDYGIRP